MTESAVDSGREAYFGPRDQGSDAPLRLCETEGCETRLSRFNSRRVCSSCESRLEIGGARIPLPRQPRFDSRPAAPKRPTTEGGVPLPGVIKGTERTYEQMIAKRPVTGDASPVACAKCGRALPGSAQGWLCPSCQKTAAARRGIIAAHEFDREQLSAADDAGEPAVPDDQAAEEPAVSDPERAHAVRKSATPTGEGRVGMRGGSLPKFDYEDAVTRFRECGNATDVGRQLGVSHQAVMRALKLKIGADAIAEIKRTTTRKRTTPAPPAPPLRFDQVKAARLYRETGGNLAEVARLLGCSWDTARHAVERELTPDEIQSAKRKQTRISRRTIDRKEGIRIFAELGSCRATARQLGVTDEALRRALIAELGIDEYHAVRQAARSGTASAWPRTATAGGEQSATPSMAELDAELTRLEVELEHVSSELGRLYYRQGAASKRMTEVIKEMAEQAYAQLARAENPA